MKSKWILFLAAVLMAMTLASCSMTNQSMREPYSRIDFKRDDFTISAQVSAEAKSTKILFIDWERLFTKKMGNVEGGGSGGFSLASLPIIGNIISNKTANYALYELLQKNPGNDIILYPQYEIKKRCPILIPIFTITEVKVTAKLAKIK